MFGRKLRAEVKELRGVIDDLRREVSFLRGQLSVKSGPAPYQTPPATGTGGGPHLRVTFRAIENGLRMVSNARNWDWLQPNITTAAPYGTVGAGPDQDDDEATGPVPARI